MLARRITERVFAIDPRSIAAFRIGLGLLLLVDLALRARDLVAHYSDFGVLPRESLGIEFSQSWRWSLHLLSGAPAFQAVLFVLAAVLAVMLITGSFTRVAAIGSWVLLTSLHVRNPLVLNGGDGLLRVLLFWSIFLPLDARWTLTSGRHRVATGSVVSMATVAILIQVLLMYFMSGCFKLQGAWKSADALQRILQSGSYAKPLAYVLVDYPGLLAWVSPTVVWGELIIPLLVLSPVWTKPIRLFAIIWFAFFHLGIELTLTVGLFSYVSWVAWILFVPKEVWDRIIGDTDESNTTEALHAHRRRPMIINGILGLLLAHVLWLNFSWLQITSLPAGHKLANLTGLRQKWNLFPNPPGKEGWYIAVARLTDDRPIDLLRGGKAADWDSYRKPKYIYRRFPNHRWRKYYRRLLNDRDARYREPLCRYLANDWNASHDKELQVVSLELHYMQEFDDADAADEDRYQHLTLCAIEL